MPLPESGVKLILDLSEYTSAVQSAMKQANELDKIAPKINVDISGVDEAIKKMDALSSMTATPKISVDDSSVDAAARKLNDINSKTVTPKVSPDDSEVEETQSILEKMGDNPIIVSIGVAGGAVAAVTGILGAVGVGGVIEYDNALAKIEGRTGKMIPQARELISDLYTSGWGESRDEIAEVIIQAQNLGIEQGKLGEATRKAFEVAGATGLETNEVLRAMDTLVKTGLVKSYTEAADLITTGFQIGGDRGEDLLDSLNEYSSKFQEAGISGQGALALINSGLKAGINNSDFVADAIREVGTRLGELETDPNIKAAFTSLDGLSDIDLAKSLKDFEGGKITGDQFYTDFFQAIADAQAKDPGKAKAISATLVGTISEDFGVQTIAQLSPKWDESMGVLEGRAEKGGTAISNTLGSTISAFQRNVEEGIIAYLDSPEIDLSGKLDKLKTGLQDGLTSLQTDGDLGKALTIALKPIGFDDEFMGLESMLGNFVIALLQVVSTLQSLDPANWGAKAGTDALITDMATDQLGFDLKVGNPDDVASEIQTAISRGVTPSAIADTIGTAVNDLIAAGTPELAASLLAAVQQAQTDLNSDVQLTGSGSLMNTEPLLVAEDFQVLSEKVALAQTAAADAVDPLDTATESWNTLTGKVTATQTPMTTYTTKVTNSGTQSNIAAPKIDGFGREVQGAGDAAGNGISSMGQFGGAVNGTAGGAVVAADALVLLNTQLGIIVASANAVAGAADNLANAPPPSSGGGGGGGGATPDPNSIGFGGSSRGAESLIAAGQPFIPGGGGGGSGNGSYTVVNNNFVPSLAAADALGYSTAANIRGMSAGR